MRTGWKWLPMAALAFVATAAASPPSQRWTPNPREEDVIASAGFMDSHPDMRFRVLGLRAMQNRKYEDAATHFRRAALYADKQSQAAYAEMLWEGRGIARDRPAAYAWMDLAAERGFGQFLAFREHYWESMDETERARALQVGQDIYARYGDDVAQPRMERVLRRAMYDVTGSRTGMVGSLKIYIPGPAGDVVVDGSHYYDPRFWQPAHYWTWQREIVEGARKGRVDVGDFKNDGAGAAPEPARAGAAQVTAARARRESPHGQAVFLFFGDECRQDHDAAAIGAQLPRARHARGDPDAGPGRSRR